VAHPPELAAEGEAVPVREADVDDRRRRTAEARERLGLDGAARLLDLELVERERRPQQQRRLGSSSTTRTRRIGGCRAARRAPGPRGSQGSRLAHGARVARGPDRRVATSTPTPNAAAAA
jgi:hypothetical protein